MQVTASPLREKLETTSPLPQGFVPAGSAAWGESAASASTYHVPSELVGALDVLSAVLAYVLAWTAAPSVQFVFSAEQLGQFSWSAWLSLPPSAWSAVGTRAISDALWIPLVMIPGTMLALQALGGYRPLLGQSRTRVALSSAVAPFAGISVVALIVTAVRYQTASRALLFSFALFTATGLLANRVLLRAYKRKRLLSGHYANNVVLIAPTPTRSWLRRHFATAVSPNLYRLVGYLDPLPHVDCMAPDGATSNRPNEDVGHSLPRLGTVGELGELLVHRPIHEVVAVQSAGSEDWLEDVVETCEYFRITLHLVPEALILRQSRDLLVVFRTEPLRLPEVVLRPRHFNTAALFVKRMIDIFVAAALLLLLAPLFILIALAIKITTPGLPVFYPWRVIGFKGRPFVGYKFTTMRQDADQRKAELMHLNEMDGPVFKIKEDPRVTPLGRFLRKYSLNELPQLWSVLKGDMSLVGPRPAGPHELARYQLWHKRKLCVQPGITCIWQVSGRNEVNSFDDWVRMDFEYIDTWSLWLDLKILVRTAWTVVAGTGS